MLSKVAFSLLTACKTQDAVADILQVREGQSSLVMRDEGDKFSLPQGTAQNHLFCSNANGTVEGRNPAPLTCMSPCK